MEMVPGAPVPEGDRAFGAMRGRQRHKGLDLYADMGTSVLSPVAGKVVRASDVWVTGFSGYGRHVVLDLGDGRELLIGHFDDLEVVPGDEVVRGDLLGTVGDTKFTREDKTARFEESEPHVHVELLRGSFPVRHPDTARLDPSDLVFGVALATLLKQLKKKRWFPVMEEL